MKKRFYREKKRDFFAHTSVGPSDFLFHARSNLLPCFSTRMCYAEYPKVFVVVHLRYTETYIK